MKVRKAISICLSVILCFLTMSPAYALNIDQPPMFSVKILSGDGKILKNSEDTKKSFYNPNYPNYQYHYILARPTDFEEINCIDIEVGEYETIKDRINYAAEGLEADWHSWCNDAFVTSTRIVKGILNQGLNTNHVGASFSDFAYPRFCLTAYLFVPDGDGYNFSHFEDQDGNVFNLSDSVTKDLILTPIYTEETVTDTIFNKEIHQVTFIKGDGSIKRCADGSLTYYRITEDYDEIVFNVLDGNKNFDNINKAFALQKYSDLETASTFLHSAAETVLREIEANHPTQAVINFVNSYIRGIEEQFFTEPLFTSYVEGLVDEEGNQLYGTRYNSVSLAFVLTTWMMLYGEDYTSYDMLEDTVNKAMNYNLQSDEEKAETIEQMRNVLTAFSDAWDEYLKAEYINLDNETYFITTKYRNGHINLIPVYFAGDDLPDPAWCFIPPSDSYVLSHFEDQDGNRFVLGEDEVTRDLVLTPVYYNRFDIRLEENIKCRVSIDTEDNSEEDFNVTVIRNHKNTLNEVFDKGEYNGTEYEYLNDKSSYYFNESDWVITDEGMITDYTGSIVKMLGIPDAVNGIEVVGVETTAFSNLYERFEASYTGPHLGEAPYDYCFGNPIALWIPKSVQQFSEGSTPTSAKYKVDMLNAIREDLTQQNKTKVEIENCIGYYEKALDITIESTGTDNCTPLAYLPVAYVVVEEGNPNYVSLGGSLYNKDMTTLLYVSCATHLDDIRYRTEDMSRGLEIPKSVTTISAFATYSAIYFNGSYSLIHAYGQTVFDVYYAYLNIGINTPEGDYLNSLCMEKFGKSFAEIEEMIETFDELSEGMYALFEEYEQRAFTVAFESGIIDEEGNFLVSDEDAITFILPYYMEFFNDYPEYRFNAFAMELSKYNEGLIDFATDTLIVTEEQLWEWEKKYIETYSSGAVTLDIVNNELMPNLSQEELTEIQTIIDENEASKLYSIDEARELLSAYFSIMTFVLITNQENQDAAKAPYVQLIRLLDPSQSEAEIEESWNAYHAYIFSFPEFEGCINRYGTANINCPLEGAYTPDDDYTYIAFLTDIPERYIQPDKVELNPSDTEMRNGTIYLKLKRGSVDVITVDSNKQDKYLVAEYIIYSDSGEEVATLTTNSVGIAAAVSDLPYGSYVITQRMVEENYLLNTEVKEFSIKENGETVHVIFDNHTTESVYSVRIPKTVVLDGMSGQADCAICALGNIKTDCQVVITPIETAFLLYEQSANTDEKAPIAVEVGNGKTIWRADELTADSWSTAVWRLSANLTAGIWKGQMAIQISIEGT